MPLQNRVTPEGEIVAIAARGSMMGNRGGALHDQTRSLGRRRWVSRQWICCVLSFKNRHRQVMQTNRYTELFFLDEATALAAGHRPCFECRRQDAVKFAEAWATAHGLTTPPKAGEMDKVLHGERLQTDGGKRTHTMPWTTLPDGTVVRLPDGPALVLADKVWPWTPDGYTAPAPRPEGPHQACVLTPPAIVATLRSGYQPMLHASTRFGGQTSSGGREFPWKGRGG